MVWYAKLVQLRSHPRMRKRTTDDAKVAKKNTLRTRTGTTAKISRLRRRNQGYAVYNTKMVVATLWALNPELEFTEVAAMQVTHVSVAHQERGLLMAQTVLGMVRTPLSKAAANTAKESKKWLNRKKEQKAFD